jgi:hypothetical protein
VAIARAKDQFGVESCQAARTATGAWSVGSVKMRSIHCGGSMRIFDEIQLDEYLEKQRHKMEHAVGGEKPNNLLNMNETQLCLLLGIDVQSGSVGNRFR